MHRVLGLRNMEGGAPAGSCGADGKSSEKRKAPARAWQSIADPGINCEHSFGYEKLLLFCS